MPSTKQETNQSYCAGNIGGGSLNSYLQQISRSRILGQRRTCLFLLLRTFISMLYFNNTDEKSTLKASF